MKNSPFRQTFIRGIALLIFFLLFITLIIVNVTNVVYDYFEDKKRNEPKVKELIIPEIFEKKQDSFQEKKVDTPKIKVVYKSTEKVIDTPKIIKQNDTMVVIDTTILKK